MTEKYNTVMEFNITKKEFKKDGQSKISYGGTFNCEKINKENMYFINIYKDFKAVDNYKVIVKDAGIADADVWDTDSENVYISLWKNKFTRDDGKVIVSLSGRLDGRLLYQDNFFFNLYKNDRKDSTKEADKKKPDFTIILKPNDYVDVPKSEPDGFMIDEDDLTWDDEPTTKEEKKETDKAKGSAKPLSF